MHVDENTDKALQLFMTEYHIEDRDVAIRRIVQDWLASAGYFSSGTLPKIKGGLATVEPDERETVQYPEFRDGDGGPGSGG